MCKECKNVIKNVWRGPTLGPDFGVPPLGLLSACGQQDDTADGKKRKSKAIYCHAVGRLQDSGIESFDAAHCSYPVQKVDANVVEYLFFNKAAAE